MCTMQFMYMTFEYTGDRGNSGSLLQCIRKCLQNKSSSDKVFQAYIIHVKR